MRPNASAYEQIQTLGQQEDMMRHFKTPVWFQQNYEADNDDERDNEERMMDD